MSVPNSYNPSDYEYLLRSLTEGSHAAKAEALKRFQILAGSDKKQFGVYSKRIILALQELVSQSKEEINIHTTMLVLEIINLNPKDIEYYVQTKLLRKIVGNLGDSNPQLRKASHYSILAFIKIFKNIDEVISIYVQQGINSPEPQLRQKAINSFQSIIITDSRILNWNSSQFKMFFQLLIQKLKDSNPFVQKASEQCLLTLSRMQQVFHFAKKLSPSIAGLYKVFCDNQRQLGNLQTITLQDQENINLNKNTLGRESSRSQKMNKQTSASLDKMNKIIKQDAINKQALIQRIQELRKNSKTPVLIPDLLIKQKQVKEEKEKEKMSPSFSHRELPQNSVLNRRRAKSPSKEGDSEEEKIHPVIFAIKGQKIENVFGKKLFEDLRNEKDWKIRLQAVEELSQKFDIYKEAIEPEVLIKNLLPPFIKLLSDQNFKISTLTLKLFEQLLRVPEISLDTVASQIVEKLGDGKVVLRQGVARLIRNQYLRLYNPIWIDCLLDLLCRAPNHLLKEEILGILYRLYEDDVIKYPFQKIIESVSPLMDDPKTKVKIRTLDLLVRITISTQRIDAIKSILSAKLNQVYFEMFVEKVNIQMKNRVTPRQTESEPPPRSQSRSISFPSLRKHKNSANDTTSTSLQKYSRTIDTKPITRTTSNIRDLVPKEDLSYNTPDKKYQFEPFEERHMSSLTPLESVRKRPIKNYKKRIQRTIQAKLSITNTIETDGLRPYSDPEKEIKTLPAELKSEDWQAAFDALTKLRRILKFHPQILVHDVSRPLIQETAKLVESLRSSLSKNAVIALGECAQVLGRALDLQLDNIFSRLMRKTLDANSFISEEVKKTLILVSTHTNESKVLSILVNYHTSRAIPVKINILSVLEVLAQREKIAERQPEKMILILVDFTKEGALEIRDRSKHILSKLLDEDKIGKVSKLIPADLLGKFRKRKESEHSSKIIKQTSTIVPPLKPEPSNREEASPSKRKKITSFPKEFEELDDMLLSCETPDWKVRLTALSKVASLVKSFPEEISQHRLSTRVIEMFAKHANDPNSKVSTSALTLFMQIIPLVSKLIESNLSVLSNELLSCFASQKVQIRQLALNLFDQIAEKVQNWMLIQHLCNGVLYGPAKAKTYTLVKIIKVLPSAFREKKTAVEKHIYSLINKLSDEPKGDFAPILRELVNMSISLGKDEAYSNLKQSAKSLIQA